MELEEGVLDAKEYREAIKVATAEAIVSYNSHSSRSPADVTNDTRKNSNTWWSREKPRQNVRKACQDEKEEVCRNIFCSDEVANREDQRTSHQRNFKG